MLMREVMLPKGILISLYAFCLFTAEVWPAFENVGIGARPAGMGGAYSALAGDINAILWNPAGLSDISKREIGLSYLELYGLVGYSFVAFAQPFAPIGTVAGSLSGSNDRDGAYQEVMLSISAARQVKPDLALGFNLKYLSSKAYMGNIKVGGGSGMAFDFGLRYDTWDERLSLGLSLTNFLSYIAYNREELKNAQASSYGETLSVEHRLGLALKLDSFHEALSNSYGTLELANSCLSFGIEKHLEDTAIRAGYRFSGGLTNGISFGLGYKIGGFRLDYAYASGRYGTQTSQFSIILYQ